MGADVLWSLLLACKPVPAGPDPEPSTPLDPTDTPPLTDTANDDTPPPADTAETDLPKTLDCASLPQPPLVSTPLADLVVHEDFAFDGEGNLVAHDGYTGFVKQPYPPGVAVPFAPTSGGGGGPASIRALPSGDFAYDNVDTASLYRIDGVSGVESLLSGGFAYANGIEIHPDGHIYLADMGIGRVFRIDAATGDREVVASNLLSPNGLTLSVDARTLYVGTSYDGLFAVPLDATGLPEGPAVPFAAAPDGGELLGLGVDACDNLYAVAGGGTSVWRYAPGGATPPVELLGGGQWFTNLQWGAGLGGWGAEVLYVNDRFRGYVAVEVGVGEKPR
jgi:hypothetical protein